MKEIYLWEKGRNTRLKFEKWRITPPGHPGPALVNGEEIIIPPEGIFTDEEGNSYGLHPDNPNIVVKIE